MSLREFGWVLALAGLPFAHLLNQRVDLWHGQAMWAQGWIVILWVSSLAYPHYPRFSNRALALLLGWIGLWTWWNFAAAITVAHRYPVELLPGVMTVLLIYCAYDAMVTQWDVPLLKTILRWTGIGYLIVLGYATLQWLNLDEFFTQLGVGRDAIVGISGNTSHFGAYLAIGLPLLLWREGWCWYFSVVYAAVLLACTHSVSAWLAAYLGMGFYLWQMKKKWLLWWVMAGLGIGGYIGCHPSELNPWGRWMAWKHFYALWAKKPITGFGSGFVMDLSRTITDGSNPMFGWRHCHNEYFQMAIEQGVIGLGAFGWMVVDWIRKVWEVRTTKLGACLGAMGIAVLTNAGLNFDLHLWHLGMFALLAYCGILVLSRDYGAQNLE